MHGSDNKSELQLTKYDPYLSLVGDLCGCVFYGYIYKKKEIVLHGQRTWALFIPTRLLWVLTLLIALGVTVFTQTTRLNTFLGNPKTVNVDEQYHTEIDFPAVTICNMNLMRWVCML